MGLFDIFKKDRKEPESIAEEPQKQAVPQSNAELTKKVSLAKEEVQKVCLSKKPLQNLIANVGLVLDFSGSMDDLYYDGTVQSVVEKTLPLAMTFDDNGTMESWIFDNGFHRLPDITLSNLPGYVERETEKYHMGGTYYAPVMKDIVNTYKKNKIPAYIIFITDGDNSDKSETDKIMKEAAKYPIFWQFVGVGSAHFDYLQALDDMQGRYVDNADFFKVHNMGDITYEKLLNEFPHWLENPKVQEMLK